MAWIVPPVRVAGNRPGLPLQAKRAPIRIRWSVTRPIGRDRSEPSPSKVAEIGYPAAAPINNRTPVPALPQSMTPAGVWKPPRPVMRQRPPPSVSTVAPKASAARAVARTSSPSSRPSTSVTPVAMAPRIIER